MRISKRQVQRTMYQQVCAYGHVAVIGCDEETQFNIFHDALEMEYPQAAEALRYEWDNDHAHKPIFDMCLNYYSQGCDRIVRLLLK